MQIAAPVLVVLFLAERRAGPAQPGGAARSTCSRSSFPVKILLTLSLAAVAVGLLPGAVSTIMDRIVESFGAASAGLGV